MRTYTLTNRLLDNFFDYNFDWDESHYQESDEDYNIELNLAGVSKENIDVSVDGDVLKIKAKQGNKNYFKSYLVPSKADKSSILAKYEDGMLYVTFTKREEEKSKKVMVN
jgi:HSP20 family protein